MEESKEQIDQPPPTNITVQGDADIDYNWLQETLSTDSAKRMVLHEWATP